MYQGRLWIHPPWNRLSLLSATWENAIPDTKARDMPGLQLLVLWLNPGECSLWDGIWRLLPQSLPSWQILYNVPGKISNWILPYLSYVAKWTSQVGISVLEREERNFKQRSDVRNQHIFTPCLLRNTVQPCSFEEREMEWPGKRRPEHLDQ